MVQTSGPNKGQFLFLDGDRITPVRYQVEALS